MIVTIDGPAGAGKSTVARRLARKLDLQYLNSGYIYRSVTLLVLEKGGRFDDRSLVEEVIRKLDIRFTDTDAGTEVFVDGRDVSSRITDPDVTAEVYRVAADRGYREMLVDLQRRFAAGGVVAEGRDMGTVIFPDADLKVYLDASPAERARRRHRELVARAQPGGRVLSYDDVFSSLAVRDERDRGRLHAPLRVPADAVVIQTDDLTVDQVVEEILVQLKNCNV